MNHDFELEKKTCFHEFNEGSLFAKLGERLFETPK